MSKFTPTSPPATIDKKNNRFNSSAGVPGKITETLGSGDNARNSIIYLTIKWSFISGCVISLFVILNYWFFRQNEKVPDFTEDIKMVWEIIIPIITLSLGYAFGKSQK